MRRLFNKRQKKILQLVAGNMCKNCGMKLGQIFDGDHVIAYSNDGKTTISNGQALCPKCNKEKGVS